MSAWWVVSASFLYLLVLFAIAAYGDRRARAGRSIIDSPWVYALSMAVYCSAWTYFGSVGRAATAGVWFLPIYLGPMLAMVLSWLVVRKMIRISKSYRINSIADFIASRYGKSQQLAGLVTVITLLGIVPYIALQIKGISVAFAVLTQASLTATGDPWWTDSTFYFALALAVFTMVFGARHLDNSERHEGMVAAVAFESLVKLLAFLAIGVYVSYHLFDGVGDIVERARQVPELARLLSPADPNAFAHPQWFTLILLAMLSVLMLPRQFQVMVVENVRESHLKRAAWVFPAYLLLINLFVLPIALGGELFFGVGRANPETYVLSLPMAMGHHGLALLAFVGGFSAATGMVIVEVIAVSTMTCNDLVLPALMRTRWWQQRGATKSLPRTILTIRRIAILAIMTLGYGYFHLAGEAYALVSIGLISFAAVAQFAPALLGGMYWRGGTHGGAMAGLLGGMLVWTYTLLLPSLQRSGWWLGEGFMTQGPWGWSWLKPEALLGLTGLDNLTHSLFWSWLVNIGLYVVVSLKRLPSAQETSQALLFVDVFDRTAQVQPVFWRGQAKVPELMALTERYLGAERSQQLFADYARQQGLAQVADLQADADLVHFVETQLSGAIGSASARIMVSSVAQEEEMGIEDVMRILDESKGFLVHSQELEEKSRSLELATAELRAANEQLKSLDRLKDDFMSSVTHELRTPLTSIRALTEMMRDDPDMPIEQRQEFLGIVVGETARLTRLVNQVLDMAKIESGHAEWDNAELDVVPLVRQSVQTTAELVRRRGAVVQLQLPDEPVIVCADADRLTQVMMNLISNAAKFTPAGQGRIEITLQADGGQATFSIQDNGPGVPPQDQALVFEKFRQGGDHSNRPQGTGLGLPISRQIVEHLGGRMWLESTPGRGARFAFSLPLHQEQQQTAGDLSCPPPS